MSHNQATKSVLFYIEDDKLTHDSIKFALESFIDTVYSFYNAEDALNKINQNIIPDCIITDIVLPVMSGLEFAEKLQKMGYNIPTIFLSAYNDEQYLQKALDLHAAHYYVKTKFDMKQIIENVKQIISEKKLNNYLKISHEYQTQMMCISDGKQLLYANRKLLDFFGFATLEHFEKEHQCICEYFLQNDNYFYRHKKDQKSWIQQIKNLPVENQIVLMGSAKDQEVKAFLVSIEDIPQNRFLISFQDVSKLVHTQLELKQKTIHDKLTKAYNREYFDQNIFKIIDHCRRNDLQTAIAIADIDLFKNINDTYGHDIGDSVLIELTNLLKNNLRQNDSVIRWGGEEFLILLNVKDHTNLEKILELLRNQVKDYPFNGVDSITCSFGGTIYKKGESIKDTIKRADIALYNSKENGRDKVTLKL